MTIFRSTARLQLHKDFTFADAERVVPYYASLGISHIYASPVLTARSGSTHGYDIVDPTRISAELGGEEGLRRFVARLREAGMGLIQDIVPNHMGVGPENPWWQHVLEWGQKSPYARWFDIDWQPADETLQGKVLAPFLGKPYGDALAEGEIRLQFDSTRGKFFIAYYDHRFPVAPSEYAAILLSIGSERFAPAVAVFENYRGDAAGIVQHNADLGFGLLRELAGTEEGAAAIDAALEQLSPASPQGIEALHALLERQHYRLAWWRVAADAINWRRFFEVTDLVGVRVEQDDVFEVTHALVFRLYAEGLIDGVRIDHVDGLADPGGYCRKLRARLDALAMQRPPELPSMPAYIIVEKILAEGEQLRLDWQVDGTSGYDFMDQVGALLHDKNGEAPLTELWTELTAQSGSFLDEVRQARRQLLTNNLAGEFEAASRALHAVAQTDLRTRDFSLGAIRRVFTELLVYFPVYRTYARSEGRDDIDQEVIEKALADAREHVDRTEIPLLDVISRWLGGDAPRDFKSSRVRYLHQRAITRFQQLTPPLAAKSVEDTAFYRYGRLLSRNEVGSDPGCFSRSAESFHEACRLRLERFPDALLATATHDHKRGEDTRTRIAALSEMPEEWCAAVRRWMRMNAPLRSEVPPEAGSPACVAPQPADELMLYQMLVGAWPPDLDISDRDGVKVFIDRIEQWQTKALREAKQVSGWMMPNESYEAACRKFLYAVLEPGDGNAFLHDLAGWLQRLMPIGVAKSLVQTVLRMTVPGIPDLYQGTDFWDFSLVDPDNRRPVDYRMRENALKDAKGPIDDVRGWPAGYLKQHVIRSCLALRAQYWALFSRGDYLPLRIEGPMTEKAIAFARRHQGRMIVVIAMYLPAGSIEADTPAVSDEGWKSSSVRLPEGTGSSWKDIFTQMETAADSGALKLDDLPGSLPVAVLHEIPDKPDR